MASDDVWVQYGLSGTPFFQEPLSQSDKQHPLNLMVGRESDLEHARRILLMAGESGRLVIEGNPGVGKTTFVNRLKVDLSDGHNFLTHDTPIRIEATTTPQTFHVEVLRELLRMRTHVLGTDSTIRGQSGGEGKSFWDELARKIEGRVTRGYGVQVAGFGAQVQPAQIVADYDAGSLHREFREAIARAREELKHRLLFHVNNFENLTLQGKEHAVILLAQIRDDLLVPGAHWLFVGPTEITAAVFRRHAQVGGITPAPIQLSALTPEQLADLLMRRYRHLQIGLQPVTPPIRPEDAADLYRTYLGDLRNFLRLLSDAATRLLGISGVLPLSIEMIRSAMQPTYRQDVESQLSQTMLKHWHAILRRGNASGPIQVTRFRAVDARKWLSKSGPAVDNALGALLQAKCIVPGHKDGRSQWYDVTGPAMIAYGLIADTLPEPGGADSEASPTTVPPQFRRRPQAK